VLDVEVANEARLHLVEHLEVSSGPIIIWQSPPLPEAREPQALRLMAFAFCGLAAYATIESVRALLGNGDPSPSPAGIALAAASLVIMPLLSWARTPWRPTPPKPCCAPICPPCCSLVWSSTPPWAGAGLTRSPGSSSPAVAAKEGLETWRGEGCCAPGITASTDKACGCTDAAEDCPDGCCTENSSTAPAPLQIDLRPGQGR
jgi:hypothetical protein